MTPLVTMVSIGTGRCWFSARTLFPCYLANLFNILDEIVGFYVFLVLVRFLKLRKNNYKATAQDKP